MISILDRSFKLFGLRTVIKFMFATNTKLFLVCSEVPVLVTTLRDFRSQPNYLRKFYHYKKPIQYPMHFLFIM